MNLFLANGRICDHEADMMFSSLDLAPSDPVFGFVEAFARDPRPDKINLMAGVYCDEDLVFRRFQTVSRASKELVEAGEMANYLPIDGLKAFYEGIGRIALGRHFEADRFAIAQALGGTGALRLGANLIVRWGQSRIIAIPDITWPNHPLLFRQAGLQIVSYPFLDPSTGMFSFRMMQNALSSLPKGAFVLLQACCQNPTGMDPSDEEWNWIADWFQERGFFPFFDFAYQGLGEGLSRDNKALLCCVQRNIPSLIAYSCSKNFSLYAERTGALLVFGEDRDSIQKILSQVKQDIRTLYSNPPVHGASIVAYILKNPDFTLAWQQELQAVCARLVKSRTHLVEALSLKNIACPGVVEQKGMFAYFHLSSEKVEALRKEKGIYLLGKGRVNLAGINRHNVERIAEAMASFMGGAK
jgi:aspartate/tyrosine/aromatic aminotransferase